MSLSQLESPHHNGRESSSHSHRTHNMLLSASGSSEESDRSSTFSTPPSSIDTAPSPGDDSKESLSISDKEKIRSFNVNAILRHVDCIPTMFRETARRLANSEAVCAWDGSLTYRELDEQSDRLARRLIETSSTSRSYVPIIMEKSSLLPIAIFGVLKSGAAFVPLNPGTPIGRLKNIVERSKAQIVICSKSQERVVRRVVNKVLVLAEKLDEGSDDARRNCQALPVVDPQDPAVCVFTSGSTGQPKGVVIQHQAHATWVKAFEARIGFAGERVFQFSAQAFDIFVLDVFVALLLGGCLCIPSEDDRKADIVGSINRLKATVITATPSYLALLRPEDVPSLKRIVAAGEVPRRDVIEMWGRDSRAVVMNGYGPAEGCPLSTSKVFNVESFSTDQIGHPLPSHRGLVVDPEDHNRLVPIGTVGELVLGAFCLAKEYIGDIEKTQTLFIEDPIWASDLGLIERRFYKTGDLVKYDETAMDGSFLYAGRKDTQVKLRGQRVELPEIEHHLLQMPDVASAVAAVPKSGQHQDQLVAVVGLKNAKSQQGDLQIVKDTKLTSGSVKELLSRFLPEYMVPSTLYVVKALPITLSDKLDRKAIDSWLAELMMEDSDASDDTKIGRLLDSCERTAVSIAEYIASRCHGRGSKFQKMLQRHDFVIHDAGLDSIQLIALNMFLSKSFGVRLPAAVMFDSTLTVRELARKIDSPDEVAADCRHVVDIHGEVNQVISSQLTQSDVKSLSIVKRCKRSRSISVFVTGATGYLGNEILRLLLHSSDVKVKALVRAAGNATGLERLILKAKETGWWQDRFESRLEVWNGDLSVTDLGLQVNHQRQLMGICDEEYQIDVVIHNGAVVHYGQDYAKLKHANVLSTATFLRAVASNHTQGHSQALIYVSGGQQLSFSDDDDVKNVAAAKHGTGYAQSKLVSELMVKHFTKPSFQEGLMAVVKPGYIVGTQDGRVKPQPTDFIWRLIASCVSIGAVCEEWLDDWIPISDADSVARTVVAPMLQLLYRQSDETSTLLNDRSADVRQSPGVKKIMRGIRWRRIVDVLKSHFGFDLQLLPRTSWISKLQDEVSRIGEQHHLFALIHQFNENFQVGRERSTSEEHDDDTVLDVIKANIVHLVETGYMSSGAQKR